MSIESIELWAAAKIIGRECASINKAYFMCKKEKGENPKQCEKEADAATSCATGIVSTLKTKFPAEYKAFQTCLDVNDYRYADCRKSERDLLDCWNIFSGNVVPTQAVSSDASH